MPRVTLKPEKNYSKKKKLLAKNKRQTTKYVP